MSVSVVRTLVDLCTQVAVETKARLGMHKSPSNSSNGSRVAVEEVGVAGYCKHKTLLIAGDHCGGHH